MTFGIDIVGGLANMLFCVATGEWLEHKYRMNVVYVNSVDWFSKLPTACAWTTHAEEYKTVFKNFDWFKNQDKVNRILKNKHIPFRHEPIVPEHGICYKGYFQSYKNFDASFIRERLAPSERVQKRVEEYSVAYGNTCSVHVRRGNYLHLQDKHVVQDMNYYNKAMSMVDADMFLVFSNDMEWCRENFQDVTCTFIEDTDYVEMFLMSKCSSNIIGNSSFSYWGAMLGDPKDRKVIYPSNWFPNNNPDATDMCPPHWIKI